jgi:hypothetical protein
VRTSAHAWSVRVPKAASGVLPRPPSIALTSTTWATQSLIPGRRSTSESRPEVHRRVARVSSPRDRLDQHRARAAGVLLGACGAARAAAPLPRAGGDAVDAGPGGAARGPAGAGSGAGAVDAGARRGLARRPRDGRPGGLGADRPGRRDGPALRGAGAAAADDAQPRLAPRPAQPAPPARRRARGGAARVPRDGTGRPAGAVHRDVRARRGAGRPARPVVVVSRGLVDALDDRQLEALLAALLWGIG